MEGIPDHIIDVILAVSTGICGWFLRVMWEAIDRLRTDFAILEKNLPTRYVMREDYKEDINELKQMVGEIWQEMKSKQDKP